MEPLGGIPVEFLVPPPALPTHATRSVAHSLLAAIDRRIAWSCERVFSLHEIMYGEQRDSSLADQLRAALMLAYNGRNVG